MRGYVLIVSQFIKTYITLNKLYGHEIHSKQTNSATTLVLQISVGQRLGAVGSALQRPGDVERALLQGPPVEGCWIQYVNM